MSHETSPSTQSFQTDPGDMGHDSGSLAGVEPKTVRRLR